MDVLIWVLTGLAALVAIDLVGLGLWMLFVMNRERKQKQGKLIIVRNAASYYEDQTIARAKVMLSNS